VYEFFDLAQTVCREEIDDALELLDLVSRRARACCGCGRRNDGRCRDCSSRMYVLESEWRGHATFNACRVN
jgi:hypothetical protein